MIKLLVSAPLGLLLISSGNASAEPQTVTLTVENMYCEACPYMVKKVLEHVSGVSKVSVSFKEKTAVIIFDEAKANVKDLTNPVTKAGFPSAPKN